MRGKISLTTDASGAARAAAQEDLVVIVDVIDMTTTAEAAWEAGAAAVYGGVPQGVHLPFALDPQRVAAQIGEAVRREQQELILIAEPRVGTDAERLANAYATLAGLGVTPVAVLPNLGAETVKLADFRGRAVCIVSATGGVAYAAAACGPLGLAGVTTATVARTLEMRGRMPALKGAKRALALAQGRGISVVAASANSLEDVLAAEYIYNLLLTLALDGEAGDGA